MKNINFEICVNAKYRMNNFQWLTEGNVTLPNLDFKQVDKWLVEIAKLHDRLIGEMNYVFCDDATILRVNKEFLNHDYYTDIITFDYSTRGIVRGDIYISLDTVKSNSIEQKQEYPNELLRVIVHGLLHLCGINDKGPGEREIMENEENKALNLIPTIN